MIEYNSPSKLQVYFQTYCIFCKLAETRLNKTNSMIIVSIWMSDEYLKVLNHAANGCSIIEITKKMNHLWYSQLTTHT